MVTLKIYHIILSVVLAGFVNVTLAATLVEQAGNPHNPPSKMWIQGTKMYMQMDRGGQYMLMDLGKKKMYVVIAKDKVVLDSSDMFMKKRTATNDLKVNVKHMGAGPRLAGYATQKYALSVNGQQCEQVLISKKAMKDSGMQQMMEAMASMNMNPMAVNQASNCERAEGLFASRMKKLGIPLGTIKKGQLKQDITRIVTDATPPAGAFTLPKGYRVINMQQYMMQMMQKQRPSR